MSAIFMLTAGTRTTLFTLDFLFLEQWHRPEEPPHLFAKSSTELHFLFNEDEDNGGLPADDTWDIFVSWNADDIEGWKLSVSPVNDDLNELPVDIAGVTTVAAAKLIVVGPTDSFLSLTDPVFITYVWLL